MMQRHQFAFGDTGTQTQTGVPVFGPILQMRWAWTGGDTGGSIEVALLPDSEDTGLGLTILACGLTPQFLKSPVQPTHQPDGLDTGTIAEVPYVAAGDRLRVRRIATTGPAGVGRLYAWVGER
jgi:hypothetical protein